MLPVVSGAELRFPGQLRCDAPLNVLFFNEQMRRSR